MSDTTKQPDSLLDRLDRVGIHQSVAARYCKEAAAEIRKQAESHQALIDALEALYDRRTAETMERARDALSKARETA